MAELEYTHNLTLPTRTGDPAQALELAAATAAGSAAARAIVADAGSEVALKLRQSDQYRFRSIFEVNPHTGAATVKWEVRLGSLDESAALGESTEIAVLITSLGEAFDAVDLPEGWTAADPSLRVRSFG